MHEILLGIAIDIVLALLVAGGKWIYGKVRLRNEQIAEIHEDKSRVKEIYETAKRNFKKANMKYFQEIEELRHL